VEPIRAVRFFALLLQLGGDASRAAKNWKVGSAAASSAKMIR